MTGVFQEVLHGTRKIIYQTFLAVVHKFISHGEFINLTESILRETTCIIVMNISYCNNTE